ncbi:hypothetical protein ABW19_dt0206319 [Dactylella cylindrospora]|nr:hypothetical protein ABW19_dt0206319 [Dactylella cylindrospora]
MTTPSSPSGSYYQSPAPYFQAPEPLDLPWSSYPIPSSLPPLPPSPSSAFSYVSRPSYPSSPPSPTLDEITENINAEFTVNSILSVSDTPNGRFYKVRWMDTWESKASLRRATDFGKYKVQDTLEWKYIHGKKLYHVRWEDTWEAEQDIGEIQAVQVFWEQMATGGLDQSHSMGLPEAFGPFA